MKNRKTLYILIPAVILIWGLIIFKILNGVASIPVEKRSGMNLNHLKDSVKIEKDTFFIYANYRDPFLIENVPHKNSQVTNDPEKNNEYRQPRRRTRKTSNANKWPKIIYKGIISNNHNNDKVILLEIDQSKHLVRKGDTVKEIRINDFTSDSVFISYQEKERTINK